MLKISNIKIKDKKKFLLFISSVVGVIVLILGIWGIVKFVTRYKGPVYEALVNTIEQKTADPVEDARNSLKIGDVIAVFPAGHAWSDTEKNSYLIVKMGITAEEAAKLTQPKTKEAENLKGQSEIVLIRQYKLDLPKFDIEKFWSTHKQPFAKKLFFNDIIKEKQ